MLTPEQIKAREGKLTASRIGVLMNGTDSDVHDLWRELIGDPEYSATDLSNVWAVALGSFTEQLNLDWYERKRRVDVTRRGEVVLHPEYEWAAATLDGWDSNDGVPIECKHVGGREALETILARYCAQFHWQMYVTGTRYLYASIIEGANEPIVERVTYNHGYGEELVRRAEGFMAHVVNMTPPVNAPHLSAPVQAVVTYDMTGNNEFGHSAGVWKETRESAKAAKVAEAHLKALVPADAARVHGFGVEIKRDRAGRLSLREAA